MRWRADDRDRVVRKRPQPGWTVDKPSQGHLTSKSVATTQPGDNAGDGPQGDAVDEPQARRLRAELTALRELVSVLAHDLSNPLQSLTVLLELAFEELDEANPAHIKIKQSLGAAQRMRHMVRDLSEFARARSARAKAPTVESALQRCVGVFERRFERQQITAEVDLAGGAVLELEPALVQPFRSAAMNALLGAVARASGSGFSRHALRVFADAKGTVLFDLQGVDQEGTREPLPLKPEHLERTHDAVAGTSVTAAATPSGVRLSVGAPGG